MGTAKDETLALSCDADGVELEAALGLALGEALGQAFGDALGKALGNALGDALDLFVVRHDSTIKEPWLCGKRRRESK